MAVVRSVWLYCAAFNIKILVKHIILVLIRY